MWPLRLPNPFPTDSASVGRCLKQGPSKLPVLSIFGMQVLQFVYIILLSLAASAACLYIFCIAQ